MCFEILSLFRMPAAQAVAAAALTTSASERKSTNLEALLDSETLAIP